jgi:pyridoxamine 5'-phosphate oxidase family protein
MNIFSDAELAYLSGERRLARIATVGRDGTPHVAPVGWSYNPNEGTIDIGGFDLERTKKYRDVQATRRAAVVIDDIASVDPWRVRGVEVRGSADALVQPQPMIRIHPERVISWGIESDAVGKRHARTVGS